MEETERDGDWGAQGWGGIGTEDYVRVHGYQVFWTRRKDLNRLKPGFPGWFCCCWLKKKPNWFKLSHSLDRHSLGVDFVWMVNFETFFIGPCHRDYICNSEQNYWLYCGLSVLTRNSRCRERGSVWVLRLTAACPPLPFLGLEHAVFKETSPQATVWVSWDCISMSCPTYLWPILPLATGNHWSTLWSVAWPSSWCKFTWSRVLKIARIFINMCIYLFIYNAFPFLSSHHRYFQLHNIHRLTHVVMKYFVRHK